MKILIVVSILLFVVVHNARAQYSQANTPEISSHTIQNPIISDSLAEISDTVKGPWDHLTIYSDSRIDTLLKIKKEESIRKGVIDGFRLQLFQGSKDEAYQIKSNFLKKYPNYQVYVLFQTPDFKVRVGDFRNRTETIHLKYSIEKDFPNPFIVEDVINFPELEQKEEQ
jgi:hypothetical protein